MLWLFLSLLKSDKAREKYMKNCMCNKWNKLSFFLFFYSYASIIFPMELHSPNYGTWQESIKPYNKYLMNRDEKEALKHNVPWKKVVPKEIIIVPISVHSV